MTDEREPCRIRWIGAVWRCETHDRYIEDGNVCPKADPNAVGEDGA